jgi:acetyltransferase-like isoleucine patch superfamily enzyme
MALGDLWRTYQLRRACKRVGKGSVFGPNIEIKGRVELGDGVVLRGNVVLRTHKGGCIVLEDGVELSDYTILQVNSRVVIGKGSYLGPFAVVRDTNHLFHGTDNHWRYTPHETKPITIGQNCYIGSRTYILPGVTIGDGAVVAPGSILNKDIGPLEVWAGAPAIRVAHRTDPSVRTSLSRHQELAAMFGFAPNRGAAAAAAE